MRGPCLARFCPARDKITAVRWGTVGEGGNAVKTVVLKNGAEEVESLVVVCMISLRTLSREAPLTLYDLAAKCRDSEYETFGNAEEELKQLGLMEDGGRIHDSIRNIVLSAIEGDGLDMHLTSPIPIAQ
jgi:hypothetical protein